MKVFVSFALLILSLNVFADGAEPLKAMQGLAQPKHHIIESQSPKGTYHLLVRLPKKYDKKKRYPTVYLLDGGITFPLLTSYYHYLRFPEEVPELIIVGISYGSDTYETGNNRSRDFTAKSKERSYWGGAGDFRKLFQAKIFPLIEGQYASDAKKRVVFGQSLGGQFVLDTATHQPDMFYGLIASNPALHRNLELFLQPVADRSLKPKLFVGEGTEDHPRFRVPAMKWIKHWQEAANKPWQLKVEMLEGQTHVSAAPESFRRGIQWLFDIKKP